MDRGDELLQGLLHSLQGWFPVIRRATGAVTLDFVPVPTDGFILRVVWKNEQSYERHYSKAFVFGSSMSLPPLAWRLEKKPCEYARRFIREVLERRGALS